MIVFISPTKNMIPRTLPVEMTLPSFCVEAQTLHEILLTFNDEDIMNIMKVNAKLAVQNQVRFRDIRFDLSGTHALSTYDGLAFKHMHLFTWKEEDYHFANQHLRILSGFYGVVKPFDSIYPYRLEMQARGLSERIDNLYSFWSDALMRSLREDNDDEIYINLASLEYSQAITPYLKEKEQCINIHFQVFKNGKAVTQATIAKMARGQMVEWMMKQRIQKLEEIKRFNVDGWTFQPVLSNETDYVFTK